jgi:hypothetical protein
MEFKDARKKFIRKLIFVILVFPEHDVYVTSRFFFIAHFEKIQALPDILREIFSKSDHF